METTAYILRAFSKTKKGGNPAGVVLQADALKEKEMQDISAILGFSETAFVSKSDAADFKVRFFTPTSEVKLCGHATVAAFYLLRRLGMTKTDNILQETKAGILGVRLENNYVFMEQNLPKYSNALINDKKIAESLSITENDLNENLPTQIVSTGSRDIMIPVKTRKILFDIRPDPLKISEVNRATNTIGYHTFTLDTVLGSTAHCRNFAPLYGIPEESATGVSNGALGCYLFSHKVVNKDEAKKLIFEQGYSMGMPSEIRVSLTIKANQIRKVEVGGEAIFIQKLKVSY